jgi:hypothetical protein
MNYSERPVLKKMDTRFWTWNGRERDRWEDLDVGERIILRIILGKQDGVEWTVWLRIGVSDRALVITVTNFRIP